MDHDGTATYYLIGAVLASLAGILALAHLALKLVAAWRGLTIIAPTSQWVTRGELDGQTADVKAELKRIESTLGGSIEKVNDYTHDRFHDLNDAFNKLILRQETSKAELYAKMREQIDAAVKPLTEKIDRASVTLARIEERLPAKDSP